MHLAESTAFFQFSVSIGTLVHNESARWLRRQQQSVHDRLQRQVGRQVGGDQNFVRQRAGAFLREPLFHGAPLVRVAI